MGHTLDPGLVAVMAALAERAAGPPAPPRGDWKALRESGEAGQAFLGRDRGVALARQILVYPMLDDRTQTPDPALAPYLIWTYDDNFTAWGAVLGEDLGTAAVSPIAATARLSDHRGLAPACIDVGDLVFSATRTSLTAGPSPGPASRWSCTCTPERHTAGSASRRTRVRPAHSGRPGPGHRGTLATSGGFPSHQRRFP